MRVKIKLKTLTPVHIGSGEKYPACQIVKLDGYYRLKERAFLRLIKDQIGKFRPESFRNTLNRLIPQLESKIDRGSDLWYQLKSYSEIQGEIIMLERHPSGELYVPGSSIKGAIRTAVQYCIMKRNKDEFVKKVKACFENIDESKNRNRQIRSNFERLTEDLDNLLRLEKDARKSKEDMKADLFRFFIVRDTNLLKRETWLCNIGIFKVGSGRLELDKRKATFFVETIPQSVELESEIVFDLELMESVQKQLSKSYFGVPKNIDEVFECVSEMYRDVLEDEKKELNQDTSKYTQMIREMSQLKNVIHIGYGGGLKAMSLFILLDSDMRKKVRNVIREHGNDVAPLSRRSIINTEGKPISPLGWFSFELV